MKFASFGQPIISGRWDLEQEDQTFSSAPLTGSGSSGRNVVQVMDRQSVSEQMKCHAPNSMDVVKNLCVGRSDCRVPASPQYFHQHSEGMMFCDKTRPKQLVIRIECEFGKNAGKNKSGGKRTARGDLKDLGFGTSVTAELDADGVMAEEAKLAAGVDQVAQWEQDRDDDDDVSPYGPQGTRTTTTTVR